MARIPSLADLLKEANCYNLTVCSSEVDTRRVLWNLYFRGGLVVLLRITTQHVWEETYAPYLTGVHELNPFLSEVGGRT